MNKTNNIISDSLEFYDNNKENNENIFDKIRYLKINKTKSDLEKSTVEFYDKDLKLIKKYAYEILGVFNSTTKAWAWGWSLNNTKKNEINIIRKLLNYGIDLDLEHKFLKTELVTSRFRITNKIQLDMHAAIASYITKQKIVYSYKVDNNPRLVNEIYFDTKITDNDNYTEYYMFLLDLE